MVTVRAMLEEDIPAALALWQELPGIGLRAADTPAALTRYLRRNPGCSFVALGGAGELAGVSLAGHDGRRGYLHHVAVAEAFRGRGIGRTLYERCAAALGAEGVEKINLLVKADNAAGLAFWKRVGGSERTELTVVSIVLSDNPNA